MRRNVDIPGDLTSEDERAINHLASIGFNEPDEAAMLEDTQQHLRSADYIQQTFDGKDVVGFALYARRFWRTGY